MSKKKPELIRTCRYYRGQDRYPDDAPGMIAMYWDMERIYASGDGKVFKPEEELYEAYGGEDYPGIPRPLLITMFSYWAKGVYAPSEHMDEFRSLVKDYLWVPSDHFPPDEIPDNPLP